MYKKFRAPDGGSQFHRRWTPPLPTSPAEIELAKLRLELGNIEAVRVFQKRIAHGQVRI